MACIGQFPPGPYDVTWDGKAMGLMEGSVRLQQTPSGLDIRASRYGNSVLSSIYLGSNDFLIGVFKEWSADIISMMWPFPDQTLVWPNHGLVSQLMSCRQTLDAPLFGPARQMVLTAVANTPAATIGPATITAPRACFAPQHTLDIAFGPEERLLALVFRLYPDVANDRLSTFAVT